MRTKARAALNMAALVVTWFNPVKEAFYIHLPAAGETKKVALVDYMRKLLAISNAVLRKNEEWNESQHYVAP